MPHNDSRKANALPPVPEQCPRCGSVKLMLHGVVRKPVEQILENGSPVGHRIVGRIKEVVWASVSCVTCGTDCGQTANRILELQAEVEELRLKLAFVTGRLVPQNRLPC
jgi:hypothetical protein